MSALPAEPAAAAARPLDGDFFGRNTVAVARDLIGAVLVRTTEDGRTAGRIVEVEAYGGPEDRASHARAGRTRRTRPMYGPVGHAYVYLVYGMHECLNVVGYAPPASAGAVLIRALEPIFGVSLMRARRDRPLDPEHRLASGPARLCQAMAVTRALDGHDLTIGDRLWLEAGDAIPGSRVEAGPRIGVDYAGDGWAARPWRFWLADSASVSRSAR